MQYDILFNKPAARLSFHTNGNERAVRRRRSNVGKFSVPNVAHCFVEDSLNFSLKPYSD